VAAEIENAEQWREPDPNNAAEPGGRGRANGRSRLGRTVPAAGVLARAGQVAALLLRHFSAYTALIRADAGDALENWRRRLISALALAFLGCSALLVGSICVVILSWGTGYWALAVTLVGALYALGIAVAYWGYARARDAFRPLLEHVAIEWARDRILLEDALRRLSEEPPK
jgi:uncharacterized membrane protein YqjE